MWRRRKGRRASNSVLDERDAKVLAALQAHGADLREPRHVIYFCFFKDQHGETKAAQEASELLAEAGYSVDVVAPNDEVNALPFDDKPENSTWLLRCEHPALVLDDKTVANNSLRFRGLAARWTGDYDGWEASV